MAWQYDSMTFNENKDKVVCTCMCGSPEHGILMLHKNALDEDFWLQFHALPYAKNFWGRLRNAWKVLRGIPVDTDLLISKRDQQKLGLWILDGSVKP